MISSPRLYDIIQVGIYMVRILSFPGNSLTLFRDKKQCISGIELRLLQHTLIQTFNSYFSIQNMAESGILFEEIFEVKSVNPDGKTFEKGASLPISSHD